MRIQDLDKEEKNKIIKILDKHIGAIKPLLLFFE